MFSKACKYGIRAVLYLAAHSNEKRNVGVDEIAKELDVPRHFLAKTLQQLTRAELISSVKGRNGGFYLSVENLNGNLFEVVKTIDGGDMLSSCILGLPECSSANPCPLHNQAFVYREGLVHQFKYLTIKDIAERVELRSIKL